MFPQISQAPIWIHQSILSPIAPESSHQLLFCIRVSERWLQVAGPPQPFRLGQTEWMFGTICEILIMLKQHLLGGVASRKRRAEAPHRCALNNHPDSNDQTSLQLLYRIMYTQMHGQVSTAWLLQGSFTYSIVCQTGESTQYGSWKDVHYVLFSYLKHYNFTPTPVSPCPESGLRWLASWIDRDCPAVPLGHPCDFHFPPPQTLKPALIWLHSDLTQSSEHEGRRTFQL